MWKKILLLSIFWLLNVYKINSGGCISCFCFWDDNNDDNITGTSELKTLRKFEFKVPDQYPKAMQALKNGKIVDIRKIENYTSVHKKLANISEEFFLVKISYKNQIFPAYFKACNEESVQAELTATKLSKALQWVSVLPVVRKTACYEDVNYSGVLIANPALLELDDIKLHASYLVANNNRAAYQVSRNKFRLIAFILGLVDFNQSNLISLEYGQYSLESIWNLSGIQLESISNLNRQTVSKVYYDINFHTIDWANPFNWESLQPFSNLNDNIDSDTIHLPHRLSQISQKNHSSLSYSIYRNAIWIIGNDNSILDICINDTLNEHDIQNLIKISDIKTLREIYSIAKGFTMSKDSYIEQVKNRVNTLINLYYEGK